MPVFSPSGLVALRGLGLAVATAGALAGCQALGGGGGGVMPTGDIGPPPSLRDSVPSKGGRNASVDVDGQPPQTAPTRQLALPKSAGASTRTADTGERRIRREELESGGDGRSASGSMAPMLSPGGSVGLGGKF